MLTFELTKKDSLAFLALVWITVDDINLLFKGNIVTILYNCNCNYNMLQDFEHVMKPNLSYTTLAKLIAFWLKKIPSAITVLPVIKCFKISMVMKEYRHHSDVKSKRPTIV